MNMLTVLMTAIYLKVSMIFQPTMMADVVAGVESAGDTTKNTIKPIVENVVMPLGAGILAVVLLIELIKIRGKHQHGEEFTDNLRTCGILIVAIALVVVFNVWGWRMIGW